MVRIETPALWRKPPATATPRAYGICTEVLLYTARKKYRAALANFQEWCRKNCRLPKKVLFAKLNSKLRGYYNYYGIRGNYDSLNDFFHHAKRILFKVLNRRSQRRSYNWKGFVELIKVFKLRKPRICHSF